MKLKNEINQITYHHQYEVLHVDLHSLQQGLVKTVWIPAKIQ